MSGKVDLTAVELRDIAETLDRLNALVTTSQHYISYKLPSLIEVRDGNAEVAGHFRLEGDEFYFQVGPE